MTDAVINTLDYISDFSYVVNGVLDSGDELDDDCPIIGVTPNSGVIDCNNEDGETSSAGTSSSAMTKSKMGQRSKGRPLKPMGSTPSGTGSGCRTVIQCSICSKTFNNSSALAKHKLIHSDERKYACNLCSKAFKRQDHLNGHMMTHYSKKPYECKFIGCDKSYCDARSLRRHLENHHQQIIAESGSSATNSDSGALTPASAPPEGTGVGMSVFKFDSPLLQASLNTSGSELVSDGPASVGMWPAGYDPFNEPKPVKCTMCDRRFRNLPALNGHMRLHGGYTKKDEGKSEDSGVKSEQSTQMATSLLDQSSNSSYTKTEPEAQDCLLNHQSPRFSFSPIANCSSIADQSLVGSQHSNLFDHSWLDDKHSTENTSGTCDISAVKQESVEAEGHAVASTDCCAEIDFAVFSTDEFFGSELISNDVASVDPTMDSLTSLGINEMSRTQQMMVEDDLPQFSFGLDRHMAVSENTTSSSAYGNSGLKSPAASAASNPPMMFNSLHHSFSDQSKSATPGYSVTPGLQQSSSNTTLDSFSVQRSQHTPSETHGMMPRYSSCFQFSTNSEQDSAFHYPASSAVDQDTMYGPSHTLPESCDGFGHPPTPKTPMFSAIGVKMQQMNLRTPHTPYSPNTPNRASRFQFPASSVSSDVQPHGYQKPAAYHPYVPTNQQQPPSSPHFLNQRHMAMLSQHDRHRFRHDVAQAQQVIDQHLHQLHQKDMLKQQQHSMHGLSTIPSQAGDQIMFNMDGVLSVPDTKQSVPPSDDVFDILFRDQQAGSLGSTRRGNSHSTSSLTTVADLCPSFMTEKVPAGSSTGQVIDLTDMMQPKKTKRKQKPEPLVIPPDVSNFDPAAPRSATWDNNVGIRQASSRQDFMPPSYLESSVVVTCGMAGGSWVQRNMHGGIQAPPQSAPLYWPSQSYDTYDGRRVEAHLPP